MIDTNLWAQDLQHMIADLPVAVSFEGKTVQGCKSVLGAEEVAAAAGELAGDRLSVYVLAADWEGTPPDSGKVLIVDGKEYRILRTQSDVVGVRYDVGDKYAERK